MKMTPHRSQSKTADSQVLVRWPLVTMTVLTALALFFSILAVRASSSITVADAWIRSAPPGMTVHAGYLTLNNPAASEISLTGASSASYEKVELHLSKVVDGIATMEKIAQVDIPAGKSVSFKPGGLHLMLIKPKGEMALGQKVPLELSFSDGSSLTVELEVKKGGMPDMKHHMHHGANDMCISSPKSS